MRTILLNPTKANSLLTPALLASEGAHLLSHHFRPKAFSDILPTNTILRWHGPDFTCQDLSLSLDEFSRTFIKPAILGMVGCLSSGLTLTKLPMLPTEFCGIRTLSAVCLRFTREYDIRLNTFPSFWEVGCAETL